MSSYFLWCGVPYPGRQRRCNSVWPEVTTVMRDLQVFWHVHEFDLAARPMYPDWVIYGIGNFLYLDNHVNLTKHRYEAWGGWSWDQKLNWD